METIMEAMMETTNNKDSRMQQLQTWLAQTMAKVAPNQAYRLASLPGDASFRSYHRVYVSKQNAHPNIDESSTDTQTDEAVYIIMDAPPEIESSTEFVSVAELMSAKVNVPDILAKDMQQGFLLLQDFGTTEFAHLLVDADAVQINKYYEHALQELIELQKIDIDTAKQANIPDYDNTLLMRECTLFSDWFVPYVNSQIDIKDNQLWYDFTEQLILQIDKQAKVLVHRDYHSRNIMLDRNNPERLGIIDFQDAVTGAYTYDFVSLVRDAYVNWSEQQITQWHQEFWQLLPDTITADKTFNEFYQDVTIMGVQRHLKVLGIFVRLSERDGKKRYLNDIPKVMEDMLYSLTWLAENGNGDIQQSASEFLTWLNAEILASYRQKFALA